MTLVGENENDAYSDIYVWDDRKEDFAMEDGVTKKKKHELLNGNPHYHSDRKIMIVSLTEEGLATALEEIPEENNIEEESIFMESETEQWEKVPEPIGVLITQYEGAASVTPLVKKKK